ncbi:MAG: CRISPR-associated endonuclease Cas3'', partial [Thermoplasmatales archaeon]
MTTGNSSSPFENNVYAKSDGTTLADHRNNCVQVLLEVKKAFESSVSEFLSSYGIPADEFWKQVQFTVSNHDFGKLNTAFQEKIRKAMKSPKIRKNELPKDVPHNLISTLFFVNERLFHLKSDDRINYGAMAAMYHHGPLKGVEWLDNKKELFNRQEKIDFIGLPQYLSFDTGVEKEFMPDSPIIDKIEKQGVESRALKIIIDKKFLKPGKTESLGTIETRRWIFPLFKQFLHLSDWIGSGAKARPLAINDMWKKTSTILDRKRDMQTELRKKLSDVASAIPRRAILQAPTGSGKTEAAIRWGSIWNKPRFIFALPTRSLVDDLYYRFQGGNGTQGYFSSETGILHSTSEYTYESLEGDDPESHDFDKYFHRPVMVTTIDQVVISLFNTGRWDAVNFSLALGALVIDEIHAYDEDTLSLIMELIVQSKKFN